jgi:hypothetical protein
MQEISLLAGQLPASQEGLISMHLLLIGYKHSRSLKIAMQEPQWPILLVHSFILVGQLLDIQQQCSVSQWSGRFSDSKHCDRQRRRNQSPGCTVPQYFQAHAQKNSKVLLQSCVITRWRKSPKLQVQASH